MTEDCIFCKIIKGDIPSAKLYEDDKTFAFLDIAPVHPGHTVIIPKAHSKTIYDISEEDLCAVTKTVQKIAKAVKKTTCCEGINIVQNNEKSAGQLVNHIHFHVIPRYSDDGLKPWPQGKCPADEMKKTQEKILKNLE